MPGIGENYYKKNKEEIYKNDQIIIRNKKGVHTCKPPKYFDKLLEKDDPKLYEQIKEKRRKQQKDNLKVKDLQTSIDRLSQYEIEERSKLDQNYKLIREFEKKARV